MEENIIYLMGLLWRLNEIPKAVPRHIVNFQYMSDINITFSHTWDLYVHVDQST